MDSVLFFMLGAFGCGSCIDIDLHLAVELFVVLGRVLLLLLVTASWVTYVSEINRAKRRIDFAPSLLRLGLCRALDVLVCAGKSCKLFGALGLLVIWFGCPLSDSVLFLRVTKCLLCLTGEGVVGQSGKLAVVGCL